MDSPRILDSIRVLLAMISLYFLIIQREVSFFVGGIILFVFFEIVIRIIKIRPKKQEIN